MSQQINVPQTKTGGGLGKVLGIAGGVVGGFYGGPGGAAAGAGLGQSVGGMVSPAKAGPQALQGQDSAMSRRVQSDDNLKQLMDAQTAVAQLPPDQQQQYAAPINQAYAMEAKRRGMNNVG